MKDQDLKFTFQYRDVPHSARSIGNANLPDLDEIISVHALAITSNGKAVVVNVASRGVDLVGGHVEPHETSAIQTLNREAREEAQLTLKDTYLLDVLDVSSDIIGSSDRRYIVIYAARTNKVGDFLASDEISERLELTKDEFSRSYFGNAPLYINFLFDKAMKLLHR